MTVIAPRGLRDVVVADTEIGRVDGDAGFYQYRQYSAIDLAEHATFEQVWFLFARGHLPDDDELSEFVATITPLREVPPATMSLLHQVGQSLTSRGMLGGLRTVLSALGTGATPLWDATEADRQADALRVSAVTPTILAALHRISRGVNPVAPRPDLGVAANWLYMVTGEVADAALVRAVEKYLIATIDHGLNASTFTARVIASTGADVFSAVCGAIGAFSGPLQPLPD